MDLVGEGGVPLDVYNEYGMQPIHYAAIDAICLIHLHKKITDTTEADDIQYKTEIQATASAQIPIATT